MFTLWDIWQDMFFSDKNSRKVPFPFGHDNTNIGSSHMTKLWRIHLNLVQSSIGLFRLSSVSDSPRSHSCLHQSLAYVSTGDRWKHLHWTFVTRNLRGKDLSFAKLLTGHTQTIPREVHNSVFTLICAIAPYLTQTLPALFLLWLWIPI